MALSGHLKELRNRVAVCIICFVAAFLVCLNYAADIVELLTDIGKAYGYRYVFLAQGKYSICTFGIVRFGFFYHWSIVCL